MDMIVFLLIIDYGKQRRYHNESYTVLGRGTVSRPRLVREVKSGKHPNHTTTKISGVEYVKAKPDNKTKNNVNR